MAAAVALPSLDLHLHHDATAVARKRRREILTTQRTVDLPEQVNTTSPEIRPDEELVVSKIRRFSSDDIDSDSSKSDEKKTQMKYDPPPNLHMSKEETAAWRREQRRKRNRESAAASRQRQRDRIVELEEELEQWKEKFNSLAEKIKQLDGVVPKTAPEVVSSDVKETDLFVVSPSTSPRLAPCVSPVSSQCSVESDAVSADESSFLKEAEEEHSKLIPRQA